MDRHVYRELEERIGTMERHLALATIQMLKDHRIRPLASRLLCQLLNPVPMMTKRRMFLLPKMDECNSSVSPNATSCFLFSKCDSTFSPWIAQQRFSVPSNYLMELEHEIDHLF